jgi:protein-S-isoprenylcysteine O-methyltransferase Ste14
VSLKWASVAALVLMIAGLGVLMLRTELFGRSVASISVQVAAVALMIAARVTFGSRSFHAAANPTAGGLVTTGPYRWLRHPIYAAILYFVWAAALDYRTAPAVGAAALVTLGGAIRMYAEEKLVLATYPEYASYCDRTGRVIPFLL